MVINACCADCLLNKWLRDCPEGIAPERAEVYRAEVRRVITENPQMSSPEKDYALNRLYEVMFGAKLDYAAIKRHFNALMLDLLPAMRRGVAEAPDPLRRAVQYAMTGNFIDFAAMDGVDESELRRLMDQADGIEIDDGLLDALREALASARRLAYLVDNCGEIVTDRVLMEAARAINPRLEIVAVVKGGMIVNDATREDAEQIRLSEVADRVVDTGCPIAGVPEGRVSEACRRAMASSDVLISKGQANYETLCGCGLNLFYIFMCKCQLFMERFNVPRFSGIITREERWQ